MSCFGVFFLSSALHAAALEFPVRHLATTPKPEAKSVEFVFPFTNRGSLPVTIQQIIVSCGCVVAQVEKKTYQPGESGVVPVTYTIGNAFGLQKSSIRVFTSDQEHPIIALDIEITLPEGATIAPKFLYWDVQAALMAQTMDVRLPDKATWTITRVYDKMGFFTAKLEPTAEAGHCTLTLIPLQTDRPVKGVIVLETDTNMIFHAFAQVRSAAAEQNPLPQP